MKQTILKLNYPLTEDALYLKVEDQNISLDTAIKDAIKGLEKSGKNFEAQQLAALYKTHDVRAKGHEISKGTLVKDLTFERLQNQSQNVEIAELTLLETHVGGN